MAKKRSLTFGEALSKSAPTAFSTMVKPVGSSCNLDCHYCYYLDKAMQYEAPAKVMDDSLLEEYVRQYVEGNDVPEVVFVWHGGEPLIAGLDFFKKAVKLQRKYAGGKLITNTLQTNGMMLDEEWCAFFRDNGFLVGISIDGPEAIHDKYRIAKSGGPTFAGVMRAVELMHSRGVEYNTLSVVSAAGEGRGVEVYRFLKSIGSRFMQFLPAVEYVRDVDGVPRPVIVPPDSKGARMAEWSVSAAGFGRFLNDIFDEWVVRDVGNYFVQIFDAMLAQWCGVTPGVCTLCETCGNSLVVEHNGDVYSCDHFVFPEHRLGNIKESTLKEMFRSPRQFDFGLNKRNTLPAECLRCRYYFACKGECPKHRFLPSVSGDGFKNSLCEGLQAFFRHITPCMDHMKGLVSSGKPAALVMPWARNRMGIF